MINENPKSAAECQEQRDNLRRERSEFYLRRHLFLILLAAIVVTVIDVLSETAYRQTLMVFFAAVVLGGILGCYWLAGKWTDKHYPMKDCDGLPTTEKSEDDS